MTVEQPGLGRLRVLVVDGDAFGATLAVQMLHGLGVGTVHVADSGQAAREQLGADLYGLCICDSDLPDMDGAELVHWIRHLAGEERFTPVLAMTGRGRLHDVMALRDAGAHLVVKKPLSPRVLHDRIAWMAGSGRGFIESPAYAGPDRRFRNLGPPGGVPRRASDLSVEVGQPEGPNMSQDEIDNLMQPMRIMAE